MGNLQVQRSGMLRLQGTAIRGLNKNARADRTRRQ
jgi:hypothetical protein